MGLTMLTLNYGRRSEGWEIFVFHIKKNPEGEHKSGIKEGYCQTDSSTC